MRKKCYTLVKGIVSVPYDRRTLPDNWLTQLDLICSEELKRSGINANLSIIFEKHVGEDATYSLKNELLGTLQTLYMRLIVSGEHALTGSHKLAIAHALYVEPDSCTAGFHDRANDLLSGFYIPDTLDAFLLQIRKSIVDAAARKTKNDVHVHNQFFIVAAAQHYGVEAINPRDPFRGSIEQNRIIQIIETKFTEQYQMAATYSRLIDAIRGTLHSYFDYQGRKETNQGYTYGEYNKFLGYLKKLFGKHFLHDEIVQASDYLVTDEEYTVLDLDWNKINRTLFNKLIKEKYFNFTRAESRCIKRLLQDSSQKQSMDIADLLNQGFISNETGAIPPIFTDNDADGNSLFMRSLINNKNVSQMLICLASLSKKQQVDILFKAVMHAANYYPQTVGSILQVIIRLPTDLKRKLLTQMDKKNADLLASIASICPECAQIIFDEVTKLLPVRQQIEILTQVDECQVNALMYAAAYQPEVVGIILEATNRWPARHLQVILSQVSCNNNNALMFAARYQAGAVAPICEKISTMTLERQLQILMQKNTQGRNALMLAVSYQPQAVESIVAILKAIIVIDPEQQMSLLAKGSQNALIYALRHYRQASEPLLEATSRLPSEQRDKILAQTYIDKQVMFTSLKPQILIEGLSKVRKSHGFFQPLPKDDENRLEALQENKSVSLA